MLTSPSHKPSVYLHPASGLTLLEVLITLAISAVALLGMATLQLSGTLVGQDTHNRDVAVSLAYDIIDRIRANSTAVICCATPNANPPAACPVAWTGNSCYNNISTDPGAGTDCTTTTCTAAQLVQFDAHIWEAAITASLPVGSSGTVRGTTSGTTTDNTGASEPVTFFTITINWVSPNVQQANDPAIAQYGVGAPVLSCPPTDNSCYQTTFRPF